ncbi:hypothetical protein [Leisingera sp. ANG-DT]|nr:hypothetical protein [Leisingera sp. ANG-DT]
MTDVECAVSEAISPDSVYSAENLRGSFANWGKAAYDAAAAREKMTL